MVAITYPAHRFDMLTSLTQLLSQGSHVNVYCARFPVKTSLPDLIHDFFPGKDSSRMSNQELQESVFFQSQIDLMAVFENFMPLQLTVLQLMFLRVIASFCGVYGFSIMFNSSHSMAATAAFIGAIANTLRLELVDFTHMPPAAAAFIGALTAGLLASFIKKSNGYPRISLTVPSIVIMVPGLYLYRAIYNFGIMSLTDAVSWFTSAIMIIVMLPLGLIFARILTDRTFRYCT